MALKHVKRYKNSLIMRNANLNYAEIPLLTLQTRKNIKSLTVQAISK